MTGGCGNSCFQSFLLDVCDKSEKKIRKLCGAPVRVEGRDKASEYSIVEEP